MTDEEIKRDLRLAKDPVAQVDVLADLTQMPKEHIVSLYEEQFEKSFPGKNKKTKPAGKYHKWTQIEEDQLRTMREEGKVWPEIAHVLNLPENIVRKKGGNMGLPSGQGKKEPAKKADTGRQVLVWHGTKNEKLWVLEDAKHLLGQAGYIAIALDAEVTEIILEINERTKVSEVHVQLSDGQIITVDRGSLMKKDDKAC